jgi:hypothetical protein
MAAMGTPLADTWEGFDYQKPVLRATEVKTVDANVGTTVPHASVPAYL